MVLVKKSISPFYLNHERFLYGRIRLLESTEHKQCLSYGRSLVKANKKPPRSTQPHRHTCPRNPSRTVTILREHRVHGHFEWSAHRQRLSGIQFAPVRPGRVIVSASQSTVDESEHIGTGTTTKKGKHMAIGNLLKSSVKRQPHVLRWQRGGGGGSEGGPICKIHHPIYFWLSNRHAGLLLGGRAASKRKLEWVPLNPFSMCIWNFNPVQLVLRLACLRAEGTYW